MSRNSFRTVLVSSRRSRVALGNTRRRARAGKMRIGLWLLFGVIAFALAVFAISIFGQVHGEEFSPQRFTLRSFRYVQIPLLRIQVWPVKFQKAGGTDDALANHVRRSTRQNRLMNQVRKAPIRWDVVSLQETGRSTYRGDASILTNYLRQPGAMGMESWLAWSNANPKLANELWGIVGQLANEDLYPIIPEVLEAARRLDASNFAPQLQQIVVKECKAFAKAYTAAGEPKKAGAVSAFAKRVQSPAFTVGPSAASEGDTSSGTDDENANEVQAESEDVSKEDL